MRIDIRMAYNRDEVERIKSAIEIIINESLKPIVNEMKQKLTTGESKSEVYFKQVAAYKNKIEQFQRAHKDHEWHNLNLVRQENAVQCFPEDFEPRAGDKCSNCLKSEKDSEMLRRYVETLREENEGLRKELDNVKRNSEQNTAIDQQTTEVDQQAAESYRQAADVNQQTVLPTASVSQPLPRPTVVHVPRPVFSQVPEVITIDIDSD